ncbi:MAG TPA: rhodanese-like domain-containing protein [Candidatus Limnocylindria bacterium]|nr:rhodanese-like domain-containing protein [Candidatus Limnocylindria bacterium]
MADLEITPRDLAARLARGEPTVLLDVREPWEHVRAAIAGAVLVPLGELPQRWAEVTVPAGALVVAYCHHGVRSLRAASWLRAQGAAHAVSLAGGIDAWSCDVDPRVPRYG